MTEQKQNLGKKGEDLAVAYLKKRQGYKILFRNYRCVFGEMDIIAYDRDVLAFIEVKTRASAQYGKPQESVGPRKQYQLSKVALHFINKYNAHDRRARFDVVAVQLSPQEEHIELIKDAFELVIA